MQLSISLFFVFCLLTGESYQNARQALHTALPESLVGRESEISSVSSFLDEHISKKKPGSLYISGAPGTGKTAVVSKSIENLQVMGMSSVLGYVERPHIGKNV